MFRDCSWAGVVVSGDRHLEHRGGPDLGVAEPLDLRVDEDAPSSLWVYQDAGVEDAVGVDGFLGGAHDFGEEVGALLVVLGAVEAAD